MRNKGSKKKANFTQSIDQYAGMLEQNKRRAFLGVRVHFNDDVFSSKISCSRENAGYRRGNSFVDCLSGFRSCIGDEVFSRVDRYKMLRRARSFLSRRSLEDFSGFAPSLYGKDRKIVSVLDCFPSLKYSYSAPLPGHVLAKMRGLSGDCAFRSVRYFDCCCNPDGSSKKARISDLSRSGSIRLDPVDAPRQLFLYRQRIQRCISWGYSVGLVPLMMTVTVFHRWHPLRGLLNVLSKAWNYFFTASTAAVKRSRKMGLVGYIRRVEETINNTRGEYNSGWHPHYHVILFVPADKVSVVSSMENELKEAWFKAVNRYFEKEFGETIDSSYVASFLQHGLFFSKIGFGVQVDDTSAFGRDTVRRCSGSEIRLRHVDDSFYMSKIMGCESPYLYSGDNEMTSSSCKNSRVPFDLLLEDTAENVDLWVEYALSTKGLRCFVFSHGLEARVREYFGIHPDLDPVKDFVKSTKVVAQISTSLYKIVEQNFKIDEMVRVAVNGYDVLCDWFRRFYVSLGVSVDDITEDMLPLPPNSRTPFGDVIYSASDGDVVCSDDLVEDESVTPCLSDSSSVVEFDDGLTDGVESAVSCDVSLEEGEGMFGTVLDDSGGG